MDNMSLKIVNSIFLVALMIIMRSLLISYQGYIRVIFILGFGVTLILKDIFLKKQNFIFDGYSFKTSIIVDILISLFLVIYTVYKL